MGIIYGIRFKADGRFYYVGQTIQKLSHRWRQHSTAKTKIGNALRLFGGTDVFSVEVLEQGVPASEMDAREIFWVNALNTETPNGLNQTPGGANGNKSDRARARNSERMRDICSQPAFKEKVSPIRKALWADPEYRAKTLEGLALAKARPDYGAKIGAHTKARWQKPGHRELVAASTKSEWADPEKKATKSASIRAALAAKWADPEANGELRAAISERVRGDWGDPEKKSAMLAKRAETRRRNLSARQNQVA